MYIVIVVFGVPILLCLLVIWLVRHFYRVSGREQVYKNGIVLTGDGIEYLGLSLTGTCKKTFSEIDSVELISYFKYLFSVFFMVLIHSGIQGDCFQIRFWSLS